MTQSVQLSRWLAIWALGLVGDIGSSAVATKGRGAQSRFNALWIPVVIIVAGAVAMTIYCTVRGYSGWEWKWTWRGVRARCV